MLTEEVGTTQLVLHKVTVVRIHDRSSGSAVDLRSQEIRHSMPMDHKERQIASVTANKSQGTVDGL